MQKDPGDHLVHPSTIHKYRNDSWAALNLVSLESIGTLSDCGGCYQALENNILISSRTKVG